MRKFAYGYNDDGTVKEEEAVVAREMFAKYIEYSENPPQELIEDVREEFEEEDLTEEEVIEIARSRVLEYLTAELNRKYYKK